MKVLLINPPIREWSKPNVFPLGLGYIASVLREEGCDVEVLDINAFRHSAERVKEIVRDSGADIYGIGGIVTVYRYVKWLIRVIRECHPQAKIVIGGSVGCSIPGIMLGKNPVDAVCDGEAEETVKDLVAAYRHGSGLEGVRGIWFKDANGHIHKTAPRSPIQDLDTVPLPAWDLFPMEIYCTNPVGAPNRNKWIDGGLSEDTPRSMNLFATRGCPYQCIYCYHDFMGTRYRHRSARNIIEEIRVLYERYNVTYFHFVDDEFVLHKPFVFEFTRAIKELSRDIGTTLTWGCSGRVNLMTEELIAAMAGAGCVLIGYGIESGSQTMLDFIKKKVTVQQAKDAIRMTRRYLGWADCSFMIGYPGENKETIQETVDFCKELDLAPEVIFFLTPYPGTELYRMARAQGNIPDEERYVLGLGEQGETIQVNLTDMTDNELRDTQEYMVRELNAWNKLKHAESR